MRSVKRKFDILFLNEILLKAKATLSGEYDKLNRETNMPFDSLKLNFDQKKNFDFILDNKTQSNFREFLVATCIYTPDINNPQINNISYYNQETKNNLEKKMQNLMLKNMMNF